MLECLKKTPIYYLYLLIRNSYFTDNKLITQLQKRAHLLDKLNQNNETISYIVKEVEICLNIISKRDICKNDNIMWAIDVLNVAKYDIDCKNGQVKEENKYTDPSSIESIIRTRRSIRIWSDKTIDKEIMYKAVDIAQWAPSSCNRQPWFVVVLSQKENFKLLRALTNQVIFEKANKIIVACVELDYYNDSEYTYAFLDMGAFIQSLLLALHSFGIGACWFGIKQTKDNDDAIQAFKERFKLTKTMMPVSFIAIGSYETLPRSPGRKNVKDIVKYL